jgi:hydrogenase/urease accessory protein HupE
MMLSIALQRRLRWVFGAAAVVGLVRPLLRIGLFMVEPILIAIVIGLSINIALNKNRTP